MSYPTCGAPVMVGSDTNCFMLCFDRLSMFFNVGIGRFMGATKLPDDSATCNRCEHRPVLAAFVGFTVCFEEAANNAVYLSFFQNAATHMLVFL
jgi:hypothetical protein